MPDSESPIHEAAAGPADDDLIFERFRKYVKKYGHTTECRRFRDHLGHPGGLDFWSPHDFWDPSHGFYSVAVDA